jgi:ribosomal protein S18 acetylase RimI-like enzyme
MTGILIRSADSSDLPGLAKLFRQQVEYQRQLVACFDLRADNDCAAFLVRRIQSPESRIFVAERDQCLVGYITVRIVGQRPQSAIGGWRSRVRRWFSSRKATPKSPFESRRFGFIEDWYVLPQLQRQGIGTRLWQAGLDWFRGHAIRDVEATILHGNEPARQLFQRLGFEPIRELFRKQLA